MVQEKAVQVKAIQVKKTNTTVKYVIKSWMDPFRMKFIWKAKHTKKNWKWERSLTIKETNTCYLFFEPLVSDIEMAIERKCAHFVIIYF